MDKYKKLNWIQKIILEAEFPSPDGVVFPIMVNKFSKFDYEAIKIVRKYWKIKYKIIRFFYRENR